jgi:uncharacterized protein (DUF433 family)
MSTVSVSISQPLYERLSQRAAESNSSPDELAEVLLRQELEPSHPYVIMEVTRFGSRAVIKDTRVGVASIAAYQKLGYSPEKIVAEILPHLTLAQAHDALSYYYDHKDEIDHELAEDTESEWMKRLRVMAGSDEVFKQITGGRVAIDG